MVDAGSKIAVVVKGYPRLSETFIAQELLGLQSRGLQQLIVSLRHPTDPYRHDLHGEITAPVLYLPEYLKDDPPRVARARRWAAAQPTFAAARKAFDADLKRDRSANRWRRWGQACVLAHELPASIGHLHTHFLHTPASVTRYAALLRGLTWSFSAHAKDIWTSPDWELREKIASSIWGVTCTGFNADHLNALGGGKSSVEMVYHGLDLPRFSNQPERRNQLDGRGHHPVRLVSVGRIVAKKGYDDLIRALALLDRDLNWTLTHIGGGASEKLVRQAERAGIGGRIEWLGAQPRNKVIATCRQADLFVLASRVTRSGDRDGIPNVLMEAQALGVACISTQVSAIPELIDDGRTGLLVPPRDPPAMAAAIESLVCDPTHRQTIGQAGKARLHEAFSCEPGIDRVFTLLNTSLQGA